MQLKRDREIGRERAREPEREREREREKTSNQERIKFYLTQATCGTSKRIPPENGNHELFYVHTIKTLHCHVQQLSAIILITVENK